MNSAPSVKALGARLVHHSMRASFNTLHRDNKKSQIQTCLRKS